jgi:Domain of unknown function (DUF5753)
MRRQQLLEQPSPPRYRALPDEAALRRQVGGPEVMADQLSKVLQLVADGKATVAVIPFEVGAKNGNSTTLWNRGDGGPTAGWHTRRRLNIAVGSPGPARAARTGPLARTGRASDHVSMDIHRGDGSRIVCQVVGQPGAAPVLLAGPRLAADPLAGTARELGVRIVAPDRPGTSRNDRRRRRSWPLPGPRRRPGDAGRGDHVPMTPAPNDHVRMAAAR